MKSELLALTILEKNKELILGKANIKCQDFEKAIKQLKDLEHFSHYTAGLWVTDRPDLLADDKVRYQINFWEKEKVSMCPYVDETGEETKSYITISQRSPWDADEEEMVEVKNISEAHKLLCLLELHFGIPNRHKRNKSLS